MKIVNLILIYCMFYSFFSCSENKKEKEEITRLVYEWQGKEILFPFDMIFTCNAKDTLDWRPLDADFKILVYVDSLGCTSCKLLLPMWKELITLMNTAAPMKVPFLFFFQSRDLKEVRYILLRDKFDYPVCVDVNDSLNQLNHFPSQDAFHTFLLGKDNRVILVGNPIHAQAIKELYIQKIIGKRDFESIVADDS